MSASLLDMAKQYLTPDVIDKLASFTGESPTATTKAIGAATPAVLAGMLNSAQDSNGLTQLVNLFQQGKFDGSMLNNLGGAFSGSSMDGLMKMGGPLLGSLFGSRSSGIVDLLAGFAGVKKSSSTSLLSAAAPFVMSLIGKQLVSRGGVNAGNLKDLLFSQRSAIAAAAPPGLAQSLGLADLSNLGASHSHQARDTAPVRREEESPLKKLLPILLGLLGLLLLFSLFRSCGKAPETGVPVDTTRVLTPPAPTVDTTSRMAPTTSETSRPGVTTTGPAYNADTASRGGAGGTGAMGTGTGNMGAGHTGTGATGGMSQPATTKPAAGATGGTSEGVGAMGGRGASGKDAPATAAPKPQAEQKP